MKLHGVSNGQFWGLLGCLWLAFLLAEPIRATIDDVTSPPWFEASIAFTPGGPNGKPWIVYDRTIRRPLSGNWQVEVQVAAPDQRRKSCGGSANSQYFESESGNSLFGWAYFIGRDCPVPDLPFRICASWDMTDAHSRSRLFGPACTEFHDPAAD